MTCMDFKRIILVVFVVSSVLGGCINLSNAPSATMTPRPTATFFPTVTPFFTSTPRPTPSPKAMPTNIQDSTVVSGWFSIPRLTNPDSINFSSARSFKGLKIPPFPDELIIETAADQPYGEVPPETIFYRLYLIRQGNTRMLWLGIPFNDTVGC